MGAVCMQSGYSRVMAKVLQVRDVPDDVHEALRQAALARGLSLTRYVLEELEQVARRDQLVRDNLEVVRATQARVRGHVDRQAVLAALAEGRGE
jgi:uncharacterized protein (DUF1778 family)